MHKLEAFADFGFPESHSVSFAYLVYSSSWIKLPLPGRVRGRVAQRAADGLLLAAHDRARRAPPRCARCSVPTSTRRAATARSSRVRRDVGPIGRPRPGSTPTRRIHAVRLGLRSVRGPARRVARPHRRRTRRAAVHRPRRLRAAHRRDRRPGRGARDRRARSSSASASRAARRCGPRARCATARPNVRRDGTVVETLPGVVTGTDAPPLPGMTEMEEVAADLWAMGLVVGPAPDRVRARRARRARASSPRADLRDAARPHGRRGRRRGDAPPAARDRRRARCSSTSRTRPVSST